METDSKLSDMSIADEYVVVFEELARFLKFHDNDCDGIAVVFQRKLDERQHVLDAMNTISRDSEVWQVWSEKFEPRYHPAFRAVYYALKQCRRNGHAAAREVKLTPWCKPVTCFPGIGK